MNVFEENALVNFKNLLSEEIILQGEFRVPVTKTTFPYSDKQRNLQQHCVLQKRSGYSKYEN